MKIIIGHHAENMGMRLLSHAVETVLMSLESRQRTYLV